MFNWEGVPVKSWREEGTQPFYKNVFSMLRADDGIHCYCQKIMTLKKIAALIINLNTQVGIAIRRSSKNCLVL